jgi:hypothetical protein
MAHDGEISYMHIPFGVVEWSNAVRSFSSKHVLEAPVREFLHCKIEPQNIECGILNEGGVNVGRLIFDREDITDIQRLKCIVIGRDALSSIDWRTHYVLVVTQGLSGEFCGDFERVGVGSIQRRHISFEGRELKARII